MRAIHFIKTVNFEGDGRLHKWLRSLKTAGIHSEVRVIEDKNIKVAGYSNESHVLRNRFFFRKFFGKHKGIAIKVIEYSFQSLKVLFKTDADILIFHDVQQYLNIYIAILLNKLRTRKVIVWDLHELPHTYLSKCLITRKFINYLLSSVDILVYTNNDRRGFVLSKFKHKEKQYVIFNNYPEENFITSLKKAPTAELKVWIELNRKPYLLWMGAAIKGRHFDVVLEAFESVSDQLNMVIMGNIDSMFKEKIDSYIAKGIIFNKYVSQEEILSYVDNAYFSIVLYNADRPNNKYCEPNRLYQLISRNIPSITGSNPTMKAVMEELNSGIILQDDGRNLATMQCAINQMIAERSTFTEQIQKTDKLARFNWNNQFQEFLKILNKD